MPFYHVNNILNIACQFGFIRTIFRIILRYGSLMNCVMLKLCLQVQPQVGVTPGTRQQLILLYWDCVPKHCT